MVVEDLLVSKKVRYTPSGRDYLIRCLNPEHEDKNPSLRVDKITGIFNCLSCGFSGNLFTHFGEKSDLLGIRRSRLKSSIEKKLYQTVGVQIPSDAELYEEEWRDISAATMKRFKAFTTNTDPLKDRVNFPINDITGKVAAICGRALGFVDKAKYYFHPPGASLPLFPAVKPVAGKVVLVEGIYDMLKLHDGGLTNACCAFGVNKVDEAKINILKLQGVSGIDILFDTDDAGQKAAEKLLYDLEHRYEMSARIVSYSGKDPGELTAQQVLKLKEQLYG